MFFSCRKCGERGHFEDRCRNRAMSEAMKEQRAKTPKMHVYAHLSTLREYLSEEMKIPDLPFVWDLEKIIDDFVFLCFFVGNDFLPHLPSLEIREGALDNLIELYKSILPKIGGYLTDNGKTKF